MRRFGLIGRPLGHSASAAYFAAKFEREGIADCTYTLYELPEIGALERLLAETPRPVAASTSRSPTNARSWRCSTTCRTMRGWDRAP